MRILYLFEYIVIVFFFIRSLPRSLARSFAVAHYELEYEPNGIVGNNEL